jgi:hypothetical protein
MSVICPHCGEKIQQEKTTIEYTQKIKNTLNDRLVQYGYADEYDSKKWTAYAAVMKTIRFRAGISVQKRVIDARKYQLVSEALDKVLPPKTENNEKEKF